jgi:hypothetical protein
MITYQAAVTNLMTALASLNQAYKAANTIDGKDKIFSSMEVLQDEVNAISTAGLTASNSAYKALTDDFKQSTDELTQLQSNINTYVNFISTASSVVAGLASEIPLVAMT